MEPPTCGKSEPLGSTLRRYGFANLIVLSTIKNRIVLAIALLVAASAGIAQESGRGPESVPGRAQQLIDGHEFEKASDLLSDLLRQDPANESANVMLGEVRLAQGLNEDALKSFEAALGVRPHSAPAREGEVKASEAAALADRNAGLDGGALLCLIRARKFVPDSPQLLLDFGIQA